MCGFTGHEALWAEQRGELVDGFVAQVGEMVALQRGHVADCVVVGCCCLVLSGHAGASAQEAWDLLCLVACGLFSVDWCE